MTDVEVTRPAVPLEVQATIDAAVAREVRRRIRRIMAVVAFALVIVAVQAVGQPIRARNATIARCEVAGDVAEQLGEALEAIRTGNRVVVNDPFQSALTSEARRTENAALLEAQIAQYERAAQNCSDTVAPAFPLVGEGATP